jgi:hypothetical protein
MRSRVGHVVRPDDVTTLLRVGETSSKLDEITSDEQVGRVARPGDAAHRALS